MTSAFVFPGQGSQSIGMLAGFAAENSLVTDTFAEASAVLGYDLWQLVSQGPLEDLNATERTQPAMLAAGVATWRLWQQAGGAAPAVVCGHSLGEFSALVAAEALSFGDAIALVRHRGELMQQAVPVGVGAIAAVLGLDDDLVRAACTEAAGTEVVEPVNFNSPGQVLPMSVPAHSSLMQPAAERFGERLASVALQHPKIPFWSPVDAIVHTDPAALRALLKRQLASPVHWSELIRSLTAAGITQFIECGPGKILTSLNRRIERRPDIHCAALEDPAALAAVLAGTGAL